MDLLNGRRKILGKVLLIILFVMVTGAMAQDASGEESVNVLQATSSDDSGISGDAGTTQGIDRDIDSGFSDNSSDENPDVPELESVLHDLENRYALMMKIIGLQGDLIDFASVDAPVAFRSRIPQYTCLKVLEERFCNAMAASFGNDDPVLLPELSGPADLKND